MGQEWINCCVQSKMIVCKRWSNWFVSRKLAANIQLDQHQRRCFNPDRLLTITLVIRPVDDGYEAYNCYLKGWQYNESKTYFIPIVDLCISMAEEEALRIDARQGKKYTPTPGRIRFKADKPTSKQVEILRKMTSILIQQSKHQTISRQFFDFFLQSSVTLADPQDRARSKGQQSMLMRWTVPSHWTDWAFESNWYQKNK